MCTLLQVRDLGGIPLLLDHCNVDDHNPCILSNFNWLLFCTVLRISFGSLQNQLWEGLHQNEWQGIWRRALTLWSTVHLWGVVFFSSLYFSVHLCLFFLPWPWVQSSVSGPSLQSETSWRIIKKTKELFQPWIAKG